MQFSLIAVMLSSFVCRQISAYRMNRLYCGLHVHVRPSLLLFSTSGNNNDQMGTAKSSVPKKKTTRAKKKTKVGGPLITLQASSIAAIVDRNPYKTSNEVFEELWKKHSPETFIGLTKKQAQQAALDSSPRSVRNAVYSSISYKARNSEDAVAKVVQTKQLIVNNPQISEVHKEAIIELLQSRVFTTHGVRTEGRTALKIEVEEKTVLIANNKLYRYDVCQFGGKQFQITGKVDRLEQQGTEIILVEIKNRMNGLFREVREYEHIQVQTYLQMIPEGIQRAKLIEQYMDEHAIHMIERDDVLWQGEILPALNGFCERLQEAMQGGVDPTVAVDKGQ